MNRKTMIRNFSCSSILNAFCFLFLVPAILKAQSPETITDVDGNVYQCVKIGNQLWMKENLKVGHYRNGDTIFGDPTDSLWAKTTSGWFAVYQNDPKNEQIFGKLYNWFAVNDPRGLCPVGWHIPSDEEYKVLDLHLGMPLNMHTKSGKRGGKENVAGKLKAKGNLKDGTGYWSRFDKDANNESGFSGLPGGHRKHLGEFAYLGEFGAWWTSTNVIKLPGHAWYRLLDFNRRAYRDITPHDFGLSVRCLKD
jgi:uncharacterized protein (TIGR02145 family)